MRRSVVIEARERVILHLCLLCIVMDDISDVCWVRVVILQIVICQFIYYKL